MKTTYRKLRDRIAAFMHRDASVFLMNGQDLLLQAVNDAKNYAQRAVDFEFARTFASMPSMSVIQGADFSQGMVKYGTNKVIQVKSIRRAFIADSNGLAVPIGLITRDSYVDRLRRRYNSFSLVREVSEISSVTSDFPLSVIQTGFLLQVVPSNDQVFNSGKVDLHFDIFEWLPDFEPVTITGTTTSTVSGSLVNNTASFLVDGIRIGDVVVNTVTGASAVIIGASATSLSLSHDIFSVGQTYQISIINEVQGNFLLDYCFDYMLFRSIWELNFYLKEDERVNISEKALEDIWENVKKWNGTIIGNSVDDANLS